MALEPAIGTFLGLLILHQRPTWPQALGIVLVVIAGAGAQQTVVGEQHSPQAAAKVPAST